MKGQPMKRHLLLIPILLLAATTATAANPNSGAPPFFHRDASRARPGRIDRVPGSAPSHPRRRIGRSRLPAEQDRARWDRHLIALGFHHFDQSIAGDDISEYHVQAAIAATHARAPDAESIDW